jgi:nitrogen fixation NifU-like protein
MPEDLDQLYRDVVLDHSKRPRNFGRLDDPTHSAEGHNRNCGDRLTVYLKVEAGVLADVRFEGRGCAIDMASASLMTDAVKGKALDEVREWFDRFHAAMTLPHDAPESAAGEAGTAELGKLAALGGVRRYPMRVKCATLPWHALRAALDAGAMNGKAESVAPAVVSTETADE